VVVRIRKTYTFPDITTKNSTVTLIGSGNTYRQRVSGFKQTDKAFESGLGGFKQTGFAAFKSVGRVFTSPNSGNLFFTADGCAYMLFKGDKGFTKIKDNVADGAFFADMYIDGKAATVLYSGTDRVVFSGGLSSTSDTREFYDGIIHCGRFFARDRSEGLKLVWSAGSPMEWTSGITGSGYIYLPTDGGKILRLINYDEKLLAVREHGITIISAYGEPQNYAVKETASYLTYDGVIEDSIAVCGGKLFFCTNSGIFAFDGNDIERQENEFEYDISAYVSAVAVGDRYCVMCNSGAFGDNALFIYETEEKSGYYVGVNCLKLVGCDCLYAFCADGFYSFREHCGEGSWRSVAVNFGTNGGKLLREVYLECEGDITLKIVCGEIERLLSAGRSKVNLFGREFEFYVNGSGRVTRLTATAEVRSGV
jgi:hypothetical protein